MRDVCTSKERHEIRLYKQIKYISFYLFVSLKFEEMNKYSSLLFYIYENPHKHLMMMMTNWRRWIDDIYIYKIWYEEFAFTILLALHAPTQPNIVLGSTRKSIAGSYTLWSKILINCISINHSHTHTYTYYICNGRLIILHIINRICGCFVASKKKKNWGG